MYIPTHHALANDDAARTLIESHALGAWVFQGPDGLVANHLPFFLERGRGAHGTLIGHVSRANPAWRALQAGCPSVVMFRGAQAYVSPGWYPGKSAHGRVVPTWDYVVAHAHGVARAVHERDWLLHMLNRLSNAHEAPQPQPWRVADAPADFIERLLRGIVGIEIPIDRLESKLKASQDEDPADRRGTVAGLRQAANEDARRMGEWVEQALGADAGSSAA
ncbi:FMN-binding negative transcriptional regulator [uncultured Hydrogenophaga sp.]|uniref:FMN-binding negative transcriptional regulator n=1 Tax=uncultured Hydrogenophaga sp. TaxID=199683 RepID=UPI0025876C02|nr:FMN-binding negative transcriptional regulator [uncultured Hydrogenophaga sp.]